MSLTAEHEAQRKIGASEAAQACGLKVFGRGPLHLYLSKLGLLPRTKSTIQQNLGTFVEPFIASLYEQETGCELIRPPYKEGQRTYVSAEYEFMSATPDFIEPRTGRPVEAKFYNENLHEWGEPGTDQVPLHIGVQCQQQMIVLEKDECDVAAVLAGTFCIYPIMRNEQLVRLIVESERRFWAMLKSRTPPPIDYESSDIIQILNLLYKPQAGLKIVMPDEALTDVERYIEIGALESQLKKIREQHQINLIEFMGVSSEAELPDGRIVKRTIMPEREEGPRTVREHVRITISKARR